MPEARAFGLRLRRSRSVRGMTPCAVTCRGVGAAMAVFVSPRAVACHHCALGLASMLASGRLAAKTRLAQNPHCDWLSETPPPGFEPGPFGLEVVCASLCAGVRQVPPSRVSVDESADPVARWSSPNCAKIRAGWHLGWHLAQWLRALARNVRGMTTRRKCRVASCVRQPHVQPGTSPLCQARRASCKKERIV